MRPGVGAPLPWPPRRACPAGLLPALLGLRPPGLSLLSLELELERFFLGDLGLVGIAPGTGGSLTQVPE
jgi:hypothetical protein